MVHFGVSPQRGENVSLGADGLAREGDLSILAMLAIQLYSYAGYMAIGVFWCPGGGFGCALVAALGARRFTYIGYVGYTAI